MGHAPSGPAPSGTRPTGTRPTGTRPTGAGLLRCHLRVLALYPPIPLPLAARPYFLLLAFHLAALLAVCRLAHWPLWLAPLLLAVFCLPQWALRRRWVESLAPLLLVYGLAAVRLGIVYGLRREVPAALGYGWAVGVAGVWSCLALLNARRRLYWAWLAAAAGGIALMTHRLWINLPAGVTGSDPFAYLQMGLDLAQRGTPLHLFPLAPVAARLGLPTLPTAHVGYVLPNDQGLAPTVWPPGYSALLALAYHLAGEAGMLSLNVWIGVLCLVLTLGLTAALCPPRWRRLPALAGLGAVAVVATSPELMTRLVVPLADGAAQALTTLTVLLALSLTRGARPARSDLWLAAAGALTGLALAAAYSVRYTQVLVGPGVVLVAWMALRDGRRRAAFLIPFAAGALLGAWPDVWYRTRLYGAPWRFGSGELALFSARALPEAVARMSAEVFAPRELGLLWPLALLGAGYLWLRHRRALAALAALYLPVLAFHLWYPFLRLRDLMSLYAPLMALCALGGLVAALYLWRGGAAARLAVIAALLALALARLTPMLAFQNSFFTFGYLRAEQRQSLETLAALTEPNAVVACSLNSGAVELYGRRPAVRPGNLLQPGLGWSTDHWLRFAAALRAEGRPVYVLMDSPEMDAPLAALQARYRLTPVASLDVPVFFVGGGSHNLSVPLYRLEP